LKIDVSKAVAIFILFAGGWFLLHSGGCELPKLLPADNSADESADESVDDPKPLNTFGFETTLPPKFSNRQQAIEASGRLDGLATVIAENKDGKITAMVTVLLLAKSLAGSVDLADEVGTVLNSEIGVDHQLDDAKRRKIVDIFRAASWVLRNVDSPNSEFRK